MSKLAVVVRQTFPLEGENNQFVPREYLAVYYDTAFSHYGSFSNYFPENKANYIRIEIIKKREKVISCCWLLDYIRIMSVLLLLEGGKKLSYMSQTAKNSVFVA